MVAEDPQRVLGKGDAQEARLSAPAGGGGERRGLAAVMAIGDIERRQPAGGPAEGCGLRRRGQPYGVIDPVERGTQRRLPGGDGGNGARQRRIAAMG